jgi:hypothetical protein
MPNPLFYRVAGGLLSPSFSLPLSDAGAGAVNLATLIALGSGTPTFTRASTAYTLLSNGLYGLVASGTARSYYSPAGIYLGYLAEGARADVLGTTAAIRRTMTDIGWVATNVTVTAATGIDGVASAGATLTATAINATILFTPGLIAGIRTYCAWVARKTGTGAVSMTADVADGYVVKTLTATSAQYQVTSTSAVPVVGFKFATSGDAITVDFNTLEAATFANPTPIPVNVSKAADVLSYPSVGNVNSPNGTAYAEFALSAAPTGTNFILGVSAGDAALYLSGVTVQVAAFDGTNSATGPANSFTANTISKAAIYWSTSLGKMQIASNGGIGAQATFDGSLLAATPFVIGNIVGGGRDLFGTIRNVVIFGTALSAAQLQAKTSP